MSDSNPSGSIITYCVEYAETQLSVCKTCSKVIPAKSVRVGEISRKNKKEKKKQARHTWWHFRCWEVPHILTVIPIEQFRGYLALNEKDKARVLRIIKHGEGASLKSVNAKLMNEKREREMEEGEEEEKPKKQKISKEADEEVDITDVLTGVQPKQKKQKESKATKKDAPPQQQKPKAEKTAKKTAKKIPDPKQVLLPKEDQLALESLASEIQASLKADKLAKKSKA
ncbi:hypothetical protein BDF14DRAFT_1872947 [Spinellus fusiger]|nr:hypothetical protein BDF14DRAFT_1872947 [Spinellus fusiger]